MNLLIDPAQLANMELENLGLLDSQMKTVTELLESKGRAVLIASPTQQGRSTTAYTLLQQHDPYIQSVLTLEHDKPFDAEGVGHNEFSLTATPKEIHDKLASMLRGDPDVVLLSRIPDKNTAELIAKSCEDVRFYLPVAGEDSFAALNFWIKAVGDKKLAAHSLGCITAQRLVRKLCKTCRRPYTPNAAAIKKLNLPKDVKQLYQASGKVLIKDKPEDCPNCKGIGYRGREGVFEVLPIDDQARALIASGDIDKLRTHLRKQKVLWLQEAALAKVVAGETDIKEITRVLSQGQSKKTSSTQSSAGGSSKQPGNKTEASS